MNSIDINSYDDFQSYLMNIKYNKDKRINMKIMVCTFLKPLQKIVQALIEQQRLSGPDLAKELNISDKAIYRHIAELQEKDIIEKFQGNDRNIVYSIKGERLDQIKRLMSRF